MANLTKKDASIREALLEIKKGPLGLTKKIARAAESEQDAMSILDQINADLEELRQEYSLQTDVMSKDLERIAKRYEAILRKHGLKLGSTKFRPEEIYVNLISNHILGYDAWDTKPAYLGGDIPGELGLDIQIKSPKDFFRVHYNLDVAEREMEKEGFSDGMINTTLYRIAAAKFERFRFQDLKSAQNRINFIKYYHTISRANWYILFYNNAPDVSAISFPAKLLPQFAENFHMFFIAAKETTKTGKTLELGKLRFALDKADVRVKVWQSIVNTSVIIHYTNAENFYKHRAEHLDRPAIQTYNAVFWGDKGFEAVQNALFAPVSYR
mgnify:CR=1 FL=1